MKKIFSLFFVIVFSFIVHAETGYSNVEWYTETYNVVNSLKLYSPYDAKSHIAPLMKYPYLEYLREKNILGTRTDISYYFGFPQNLSRVKDLRFDGSKRWLIGIVYILSKEKTSTLLDKYNNQVAKIFIKNGEKELEDMVGADFLDLVSIGLKKDDFNTVHSSLIKMKLLRISINYEEYGLKSDDDFHFLEKSNATTSTLYIYDYNDDTRVYIYDNIIKDKAGSLKGGKCTKTLDKYYQI